MLKKIINIILITFLITSCGAMGEVKRGLTGSKKQSTDEFFIQKKDPLILPPNYKDLPTPDEKKVAKDEISEFEKSLGTSIEDTTSNSNSNTEESILKRIKNK
jgi:hypothetical protein